MYSTCLFCSASLGTNEAIESFPVGNRVAFDAWKGRLWAVCSRCGRWNLAPIEERWEAVEAAERLFVDTRTRVHSENIGLARLRDGTRLIRVGNALPGELAAWRYGGELISRRRRNIVATSGALAAGTALALGFPLLAATGAPLAFVSMALQIGSAITMKRQRDRVIHRVRAAESPTGAELLIRRWHLYNATLGRADDGTVAVDVPQGILDQQPFRLTGAVARTVIARSLTDYNAKGASEDDVARALRKIDAAGGTDAFVNWAAGSGSALVRLRGTPQYRPPPSLRQVLGTFRGEVLPVRKQRTLFPQDQRPLLNPLDGLALEMALQEETERRALEGELAALEAAWREAEEIAHIADNLLDGRLGVTEA